MISCKRNAADNITRSEQHCSSHQLLYRVGVGARGIENRNTSLAATFDGNIIDAGPRTRDCRNGVWDFCFLQLMTAQQDGIRMVNTRSDFKPFWVKAL